MREVDLTTLPFRGTATGMESSSVAPAVAESSFGAQLNAPQAEAVRHTEGPLLVLAGAGSGKTRVITFRIAELLATHRVPPYKVLAVTFTNKAAGEMRRRLETLLGNDIVRDLWIGTFHATCARLLRRYHDAAGLARDFVIYDESDQKAVVARAIKNLRLDDKQFPPRTLLSWIHRHKQEGVLPAQVLAGDPFGRTALRVYEHYETQLATASATDFDDLILKVLWLVEDPQGAAGCDMRGRFRYVLVDEFQDANPVQYRLVRALAAHHHNLCVVGDDDQSIYRWRGADVRIIRGFQRDFPNAKLVKLEQNYRSSGNIVRAALGVIQPSAERQPKQLFTRRPAGEPVHIIATLDERDEAATVVERVRSCIASGLSPREIAIFYRIHAQSRVWKKRCGRKTCLTKSLAVCDSSIARKSKTCSRTSACSRTLGATSTCFASSTRLHEASATPQLTVC